MVDKFFCPQCQMQRRIEAITLNAECHQTVIMENDELRYGEITIDDGTLDRFQCEVCGYMIPDESNTEDELEQNIVNLLKKQADPIEQELKQTQQINSELIQTIIEIKRIVQQYIKAQANRGDRKTLEIVNKGCDRVAKMCVDKIEKYRSQLK